MNSATDSLLKPLMRPEQFWLPYHRSRFDWRQFQSDGLDSSRHPQGYEGRTHCSGLRTDDQRWQKLRGKYADF